MKFVLLLLLALPVCALADQESDFRAAREALRVGNASRLDKMAERLKDTPLEPYVTYYQLRMHWGTKATEPIKAFLARTANRRRRSVPRRVAQIPGRARSWEEFAEEYPHLVNIDDELTCYALQLRQQSDEAGALAEARKLWLRGEEMPDSCTPLFEEAMKQGVIGEADVWQRMRLALENNNTTLARQLIKKLPKAQVFPAAELSMAGGIPRRYLDKTKFENAGTGRRLAGLFALQAPVQAVAADRLFALGTDRQLFFRRGAALFLRLAGLFRGAGA